MDKHGYGTVYLNDPNAPGTRTFTNEYTEFCLSCHNSNPPEGVKFPEEVVETKKEANPNDFSYMLESYGDSGDDSDSSMGNQFSGFSSFSEDESSSSDANDANNDSFGFGGYSSTENAEY